MNLYPKFLVFRFPPGAGGNFLSSLLQCNENVGHWNDELEYNKPNSDWVAWFENCFDKNFKKWLDKEPVANHKLGTREIFSAWYDRGNTLNSDEFFTLEKKFCTPYYFYLKNKNLFIPIFWHKNYFPVYFENSVFVDIMLDQLSLKWFDRSWYYKHHDIVFDTDTNSYSVCRQRHRPSIQPSCKKFNNEYQATYSNFRSLVRQEIYNNPWRQNYLDKTFLDLSSGQRPRYILSLSSLLSLNNCYDQYKKICNFLKITAIDYHLFEKLFLIWRNRHDY